MVPSPANDALRANAGNALPLLTTSRSRAVTRSDEDIAVATFEEGYRRYAATVDKLVVLLQPLPVEECIRISQYDVAVSSLMERSNRIMRQQNSWVTFFKNKPEVQSRFPSFERDITD